MRDAVNFTALWIPCFLLAKRFWFICDDAFITFQFSKNLALGNGVRFNPGEHIPVEGYSNFLWMLVGAVIETFRLNIELWPCVVSVACGTILLWLVYRTLRDRLDVDPALAGLAVLIVGLYPPFAVYMTSGMETMAFALLLFVTFERFVLRRGGIEPIAAGLAALGLSLIRVEGIGWALTIIVLAVLSRKLAKENVTKSILWSVAILVLGFVTYWSWRYSYYGLPLPNTVYAKSGMSTSFLGRGINYVIVMLLTELTPLLAIPATAAIFRSRRLPIGLAIAAMALGVYVYAVLVGGDFMAMGRLLAPGWPFAALLFGWMMQDLSRSRRLTRGRWMAIGVGVVIVVMGLLPAFDIHIAGEELRRTFHFRLNQPASAYRSEYKQWTYQKDNAMRWAVTGRALKRWAEPDASVVRGAIGALGYYSDLFIYDLHGLLSREATIQAHQEAKRASPGHDRAVTPDFFLGHEPAIMIPRVVDGLPGRDRSLPEGQSRRLFVDVLRRQWVEPLRNFGWQNRYVVDFRPVPDWEYGGPGQYLVFWRRIEGDATREWAALKTRLEDYEAGRDVYRSTVDDGYPHPR
jgi:hypothetical protein